MRGISRIIALAAFASGCCQAMARDIPVRSSGVAEALQDAFQGTQIRLNNFPRLPSTTAPVSDSWVALGPKLGGEKRAFDIPVVEADGKRYFLRNVDVVSVAAQYVGGRDVDVTMTVHSAGTEVKGFVGNSFTPDADEGARDFEDVSTVTAQFALYATTDGELGLCLGAVATLPASQGVAPQFRCNPTATSVRATVGYVPTAQSSAGNVLGDAVRLLLRSQKAEQAIAGVVRRALNSRGVGRVLRVHELSGQPDQIAYEPITAAFVSPGGTPPDTTGKPSGDAPAKPPKRP